MTLFEKEVHHVNIHSGFLINVAEKEIVMHHSKAKLIDKVTNSLINCSSLCFSSLTDSLSSAKSMR